MKAEMDMHSRVFRHLTAIYFLVVSNFLWALHDWYFQDPITRDVVCRFFGDWHILKGLVILMFFLSVKAVPWKVIYLIGFAFSRWGSFELFLFVIPKAVPYDPSRSFMSLQSAAVAIVVTILGYLVPTAIDFWTHRHEDR